MWRAACLLNNLVIRNKEILRLKMLCEVMSTEITVVYHGCYVHFFPVLLVVVQLTLLTIFKTPFTVI